MEQILQSSGLDISNPDHIRTEACKYTDATTLAEMAERVEVPEEVMRQMYPHIVEGIQMIRGILRDAVSNPWVPPEYMDLLNACLRFYDVMAEIRMLDLQATYLKKQLQLSRDGMRSLQGSLGSENQCHCKGSIIGASVGRGNEELRNITTISIWYKCHLKASGAAPSERGFMAAKNVLMVEYLLQNGHHTGAIRNLTYFEVNKRKEVECRCIIYQCHRAQNKAQICLPAHY
ncbi:hypothetical protein CAPTEDRAFT_211573 [Capitella teleta]|uniref:Uncharacterized protein n=1 Tax=Capitella teleta TaxID=283909 RepID=R7TV55_CAPTE|nr:hypothetical protein CAPTEDRAFT_211573 [Capitella teleta]|eukprot:ELT95326.1 hypothetical protein CAPTEDRAFT_211573 [Capitella teleta]